MRPQCHLTISLPQISDLLFQPTLQARVPPPLALGEDPKVGVVVRGAKNVPVSSPSAAMDLLEQVHHSKLRLKHAVHFSLPVLSLLCQPCFKQGKTRPIPPLPRPPLSPLLSPFCLPFVSLSLSPLVAGRGTAVVRVDGAEPRQQPLPRRRAHPGRDALRQRAADGAECEPAAAIPGAH